MKHTILSLLVLILGMMSAGFYVKAYVDSLLGNRMVGISVLLMSFVFMPLFLYYRYRNRKIQEYELKSYQKKDDSDTKKYG